jgi:hypothetical protein
MAGVPNSQELEFGLATRLFDRQQAGSYGYGTH